MEKELKRMNYFDGLFLKAEDYKQDREYQRRLQGFHNRYLHTWGIACGLEVKPVMDSSMEVYVTEGAALELTDEGQYGSDIKESTSREILIYNGHPDNPLDLSEYQAEDNIYITVSYCETEADRDNERGQGEEIHIWERGCISHSKVKPEDHKKNIILARVVPRAVSQVVNNDDGTSNVVDEIVIDSTCIFDTDSDGTTLRVYAGPYARVLELGKFIFKIGEGNANMPFLVNPYNEESEENQLESNSISVEDQMEMDFKSEENQLEMDFKSEENQLEINSKAVKFNGMVEISEDLSFEGELISKKDGVIAKEFETEERILQVNSCGDEAADKASWKLRDGGLEVYRGGPSVAPDARIVWSEVDKLWKAGLGNELSPIVNGANSEKLINYSFADDLHKHSKLSSPKGVALSIDDAGNLSIKGDLAVNENDIWLSSENKNGAITWYGEGKPFYDLKVEGPVLTGVNGGLLGTTSDGQKAVLFWNKTGNVGIGSVNSMDDKLDIAGSSRLLIGSNPVRFTSEWTAFPDLTTNQAEICNDTTYHKALMIVGNQSAGQGRKVAIWDRLDVNGFLYVNGGMKMSQALTVSAGTGNNGIIFPSNPGGGSSDSAWLKYYPRRGEACTLEIGTSNDGDDNISLMPSGNVGIGMSAPNDKLDTFGWMRILSGTNPIRFTSSWSGFPDQSSKHAEFCNDTTNYKTLMIVGNRSAGQGRKVSIWDRLDVNGPLVVNGNLHVTGAIIPGVGNCEVKGIMFPKNPGGGSGDAAWIRYYSDASRGGGENMTLEIGIANDSNKERIIQNYWTSTCPWNLRNGCGYWTYIDRTIYGNQGDRLRLFAGGGTYIEGNFYYTSSAEYKENISDLSKTAAQDALGGLEPVEFNFIGDNSKTTMGFIAENVPDTLAAYDRRAISPMEIIAVLVSEVKDQEKALSKLKKKVVALKR